MPRENVSSALVVATTPHDFHVLCVGQPAREHAFVPGFGESAGIGTYPVRDFHDRLGQLAVAVVLPGDRER